MFTLVLLLLPPADLPTVAKPNFEEIDKFIKWRLIHDGRDLLKARNALRRVRMGRKKKRAWYSELTAEFHAHSLAWDGRKERWVPLFDFQMRDYRQSKIGAVGRVNSKRGGSLELVAVRIFDEKTVLCQARLRMPVRGRAKMVTQPSFFLMPMATEKLRKNQVIEHEGIWYVSAVCMQVPFKSTMVEAFVLEPITTIEIFDRPKKKAN